MDNQELFAKIEAKEREWDSQVKLLRSRIVGFDVETRGRIEEQIDHLTSRLREIEKHTNQLKRISQETQHNLSEKIIHSWIELFTEIDNAMLKLIK